MTLKASSSGDFKHTMKFLKRLQNRDEEIYNELKAYGDMGLRALRNATPKDSGITAESWDFEIDRNKTTTTLIWTNSSENSGANIAILLQYGHATGTGGYVQGRDYINQATKPTFDKIESEIWAKIKKQ